MIESALLLLLEAGAHEMLSRSPWLFRATPIDRAAAAGFLEWRRATEQRARVLSTVVAPLVTAQLFLRHGWAR